jgi:hypothetical protein
MLRALLPVTLFAALATGCYTEADVGYTAGYVGPAPTLAYVSPGVQVVYDAEYPVFFADGFYWRWYGGTWMRSPYYNRGWAVSYNVPVGIRSVQRPWTYSHYRGSVAGPVVRDHRGYRPAPAPHVRDHRR